MTKYHTVKRRLLQLRLPDNFPLLLLGILILAAAVVSALNTHIWLPAALLFAATLAIPAGIRRVQRRIDRRRRRVLPELPGETLVTITIYGNDPLFPALVDTDEHWNGAAIPCFRREVAGYVVDWLNETYAEFPEGSDRAYWDGRTVVVIESQWEDEPGYTPVRVAPDEDGRYCIGGHSWTWEFA